MLVDHLHEDIVSADLVPEEDRLDFLPYLFGDHFTIGERCVYNWMMSLSSYYDGGYWHFYVLNSSGGYMAPATNQETILIQAPNFYEGDVSPDALGIIVTLYALSQVASQKEAPDIGEHFLKLRDYAHQHAEAQAIFAAID